MRKLISTLAIAIALVFSASFSHALAAQCALKGTELACEGNSNIEVLVAFGSDATSEILDEPLEYLDRFDQPSEIEAYRKSVESNWQSVLAAERKMRRRLKRVEISAADFEDWSKDFDRALVNYRKAILFYRTLVWHGKTEQ